MMWRISGDGDSRLIMDGNRVVGSLVKIGDEWRVEILWWSQIGDLRFNSASYEACLAYISGACAMATRMTEQLEDWKNNNQ
jgi:hypothetical protein